MVEKSKEQSVKIIKIATAIIAIYWVSQNLGFAYRFVMKLVNVCFPAILGGAMAFVLHIPMRKFEEIIEQIKSVKLKRFKQPIAFALSVLSIVAVATLILLIVVPELINTVSAMTTAIPSGFNWLKSWIEEHGDMVPQVQQWLENLNLDWSNIIKQALSFTSGGVSDVFGTTFSIISSLADGVITTLLAFIIAIYIIFDKEAIGKQVKRFMKAYFPEKVENLILMTSSSVSKNFTNFIIGKCLDAIIVGLMCASGMFVLRLPYAAMIGVIVGVTALVPIVGGYIGLVIGALLIVVVNPMQALEFVLYLLIMQTFEGNVIYPKLLSNKIELKPLWILVSITIGGGLLGVLGMLIAVPIAATISEVMNKSIENRLEKINKKAIVPRFDDFDDDDDELSDEEYEAKIEASREKRQIRKQLRKERKMEHFKNNKDKEDNKEENKEKND